MGISRVLNSNGISIDSSTFAQTIPILYNGTPLPPSKLPLPWEHHLHPRLIYAIIWFPGPTRVLNLNGILIVSAVSARLTSVTDRPTDGNNIDRISTYVARAMRSNTKLTLSLSHLRISNYVINNFVFEFTAKIIRFDHIHGMLSISNFASR